MLQADQQKMHSDILSLLDNPSDNVNQIVMKLSFPLCCYLLSVIKLETLRYANCDVSSEGHREKRGQLYFIVASEMVF